MLIQEINESNFAEERVKGSEALDLKFAAYDLFKKTSKGLKDEELTKSLANFFKDPTIWAYATLKDPQNNPLRLHPFQDTFVNDKHRFQHITAANQIGKTLAVELKAIHHAIHTPNGSVIIISKSEQQAIKVLDEIKWFLKRSSISFSDIMGEIENRTELHLKSPLNGVSTIRSLPPTTSILGYSATLVIMDETGFWEKGSEMGPTDLYTQVIEPRTNATKNWKHPFLTMGQIISISNPNGKQGLAYDLFNDERFHQYIFCWLANPNNSLEEYLSHKKRLPGYRFASIYAATYLSAEGGFITYDQYKQFESYKTPLVIDPTQPLFLGGDFAGEDVKGTHKSHDSHVLYGVQPVPTREHIKVPRVKLVYVKEFPKKSKKEIVYEEIRRIRDSGVSVAKFAYDKVGVGDSVKMDLIERGILSEFQIEALTYSLPNKSEVFIHLQTLFAHGLIEGNVIPSLQEQLLGLEVEQPLGSMHLKIHHKTEGLHDDHCFVAGTLVLTEKGQVPIEQLKIGDKVLTRNGFQKIIATGNRISPVISRFGITGTPDHPFITKKGIRLFKYLNVSDTLYIWNEKQLSIMEGTITDILNQKGDTPESTSGHISNGKNRQKHFIGRFGRIITDPSQKASASITKMRTLSIIPFPILSVFLPRSTEKSIKQRNFKQWRVEIFKNTHNQRQLNGMVQKKEKSGIGSIISKVWQKLRCVLTPAQTVKKNTKTPESIKQNTVADTVDTSAGKARVYNIRVQNTNEFFANNILVHNCDALANACYAAKRLLGGPVDVTIVNAPEPTPSSFSKKRGTMQLCPTCEEGYWENQSHVCPLLTTV